MASFSNDAPTTPLRQRMQEDMVMRGLGSHTQQDDIRHVRRFATFLGRTLTPQRSRTYDISSCISMRTVWGRPRSTARFRRYAFCLR